MMFSFGKPLAEPTSYAIRARRAIVPQGSSIVDLSTRWSLLRALRNRTQAGAFPDRYRSKPLECVRAAFRLNSTMHVR